MAEQQSIVPQSYDNAPMESFFSSMKTELVHRTQFRTRREGIVTLTWIGREKTSKGRKSAFYAALRTHVSCFQTSNALVR